MPRVFRVPPGTMPTRQPSLAMQAARQMPLLPGDVPLIQAFAVGDYFFNFSRDKGEDKEGIGYNCYRKLPVFPPGDDRDTGSDS